MYIGEMGMPCTSTSHRLVVLSVMSYAYRSWACRSVTRACHPSALLSNSFSLSHNEPPAPPSPPSGCGRGAGPASAAFRSANPSPLPPLQADVAEELGLPPQRSGAPTPPPLPPLQADVAEELGLPPQRSVTTRLRLSAIERHFYRRQHKVRRKGGGASRSGAGVLVLTQAV